LCPEYQFYHLAAAQGGVLVFGPGHGVDAGCVVDGSVEIVNSESQSHTRTLFPQHRPVGLEMGKVVEIDS